MPAFLFTVRFSSLDSVDKRRRRPVVEPGDQPWAPENDTHSPREWRVVSTQAHGPGQGEHPLSGSWMKGTEWVTIKGRAWLGFPSLLLSATRPTCSLSSGRRTGAYRHVEAWPGW